MKRRIRLSLLLLALFVLTTALAYAKTGDGYDLTWSRIASGGEIGTGGGYTLSSTSGQADAGVVSGNGYTLISGFGSYDTPPVYKIYLPFVT